MKKIAAILCFILMFNISKAQWPDSMRIEPQNPTITDTVKLLVFVSAAVNFGLADAQINIYDTLVRVKACYEFGDLQTGENRCDTFNLGQLAIQNYNILYLANERHLSYHSLPTCQPDSTTDTAWLNFRVYPTVGVNEIFVNNFSLSPNPVKNVMHLSFNSFERGSYEIYSPTGVVLASGKTDGTNYTDIDVSALMRGTYFIRVQNTKKSATKRFVKM